MSWHSFCVLLVDGKHMSQGTFEGMYWAFETEAGQYIAMEIYNDDNRVVGMAVGELIQRYKATQDGAFVKLRYKGCNDADYRWYIENVEKTGGLHRGTLHHLCRVDPQSCRASVHSEDIIHIRKWAPLGPGAAHDLLVEWGYPGLTLDPAAVPCRVSSKTGREAATKRPPADELHDMDKKGHPKTRPAPPPRGHEEEDQECEGSQSVCRCVVPLGCTV